MISSNLSRVLRPTIRPRTSLIRGATAASAQPTTSQCCASFSSMSIITCKGRNKSYPHPHPCNTYTFRTFSTDKSKAAATVTESEASNSALASDSTETEETPIISEPRKFPTRHSRHHPPAIAQATVLKVETDNILNSRVGSLFGMLCCVIYMRSVRSMRTVLYTMIHECNSHVIHPCEPVNLF